jgi:hypothetical protein
MSFEDFWRAYPRRIAKFKARTAWDRALKFAKEYEIMEGVKRYALELRDENPRFIKHPSTWLNGGCWMDDPGANCPHEKGYAELAEELRNGYDAGCSEPDLFGEPAVSSLARGRGHH